MLANGPRFRFGAAARGVAVGLSKNTIILQITSALQYYREWHSEFKKKMDGRRAQFQSGNLAPVVFMNPRKGHFPAPHGVSQEGPPKRSLDGALAVEAYGCILKTTPQPLGHAVLPPRGAVP